jgi:hypothetical protein
MSRADFGRSPIARQPWDFDEIIPAIPDNLGMQDVSNSPLEEREVGKYAVIRDDFRKRSVAVDFDVATGELKVLAFDQRINVKMLAEYLKAARAEGKQIKSMSVSMTVESAREFRFDAAQANFVRDESRDTPLLWTYVNPLTVRPKMKKPKAVPEPEVKLEPIVAKMTIEQYREAEQKRLDLLAEIDRLRRLRDEHAGKDIT